MSTAAAISVRNVSKAYRIWETPSARLTSPLQEAIGDFTGISALNRRAARNYRDFWALKDVSLEVAKGEAVGVIGRNGSGKSTLLQLIAGTLQPTSGTVAVHGKVAALLELGSGFNPEFTGRENIFLNGAVLGLSRHTLEAKFDEIAAFADIGDFIDQPVKTYSSGMAVRLAFAVAVAVEPDVLIVDEALSVGDVFFQQKCFKRVHQMLAEGVSLLFVSHDTAAVQNLCTQAVLLKAGEVVYAGAPEEAASRYFAVSGPSAAVQAANCGIHEKSERWEPLKLLLAQYNQRHQARSEHGAQELVVEQIAVFNSAHRPAKDFKVGDTLHVVALLQAKKPIVAPSTGLHLYDRMNGLVFAAGTRQRATQFGDFAEGETRLVEFQLELSVQPGDYTFSIGCSQPSDDGANLGYIQHRLEGLGPITVLPAPLPDGTWPFYGQANLPFEVRIHG